MAAHAAADAVRRALRRLHACSSTRRRRRATTPSRCCSASCCSRSSPRRPAARSRSLVDRENLVRKVEFPRLAVPLSRVLTALMNLVAEPRRRCSSSCSSPGGTPRWRWLELPFAHRAARALRAGSRCCSRRCSSATATSSRSGTSCCRCCSTRSPILYTLQSSQDKASTRSLHLLAVNPFAAILQQARHAMLGAGHYSAAEAIGGELRLLVPARRSRCCASRSASCVFDRRAARIAEDL